MLRTAGYQTAMIGKWHLKTAPTGFDYWEVLPGQGTYYNPKFRTVNGVVQYTGYTTQVTTDLALDWLKTKRDTSKPFLLMYQHKAPHRDWQPGPEYLTMYDEVAIPEPVNLFDDYAGRGTAARTQEMTVSRHLNPRDLKLEPPPNLNLEQLSAWNNAYAPKNREFNRLSPEGDSLVRWKYQRYIKDYLRAVAAVDDEVGRVLRFLDQSGLTEKTIVVYSSDQGFYLGDHGWFDKRFMYEESLRMPLLIRWPGLVAAGSSDSHLVQNLDFAPTFLQIAGVQIPEEMQGRSLVPLLRGDPPENWRKSVYYHYYEFPAVHMVRRHCGVRTDRFKLIHFYNLNEWEFYDLERDPNEMRNLYSHPAYSDVVEELKEELARLRKHYQVPDQDPQAGRKL